MLLIIFASPGSILGVAGTVKLAYKALWWGVNDPGT